MSVNRWPFSLPQASAPGFGLSPVDQSLRTNMEIGAQRVRRRTLARFDKMTAEWRMTETEFTAFRAWAESAPYSLSNASDDFSAFSLFNVTRLPSEVIGPDGIAVDRMLETSFDGIHRIGLTMAGAAVNNANMVLGATLKSVNGAKGRIALVDRTDTSRSVNIDLSDGTLSGADGVISASVQDRGNGWWRVSIVANTDTGGATPVFRISALSSGGSPTYVGDPATGLDICEIQARFQTGYDLFLPTGADGKVLGSGGGASWFYMPVASGNGLNTAEARFTGPYKVATQSALRRVVTAEVEVRNA